MSNIIRLFIFKFAFLLSGIVSSALVLAETEKETGLGTQYTGNFVLEEGDKLPRSKTSERYHKEITEVLSDKDFGHYEAVKAWRLKDKDKDQKNEDQDSNWDTFIDWLENALSLDTGAAVAFASVLELLLWAALAGLLAWLVFAYKEQIKGLLAGGTSPSKPDLPVSLFGVKLQQSKLPENIVASAVMHWNNGERREAMALLLRASLLKVLNRYPCHLFDSDTENECVAKIEQASPNAISTFMRKLVDLWLALAYAHRLPSEHEFQDLCSAYQEVF